MMSCFIHEDVGRLWVLNVTSSWGHLGLLHCLHVDRPQEVVPTKTQCLLQISPYILT